MKNKKITNLIYLLALPLILVACGENADTTKQAEIMSSRQKIVTSYKAEKKQVDQQKDDNDSLESEIERIQSDNTSTEEDIDRLTEELSSLTKTNAASTTATTAKAPATTSKAPSTTPATSTAATLANLNYGTEQEITVDQNNPNFSNSELSTAKGAWETYNDLDGLNRAVDANALLNQTLMPTEKRTGLTWDPTGWKNKRTAHGWLYNRSHLIGFQLSGENNNPKNLITGTQSLNNPLMLSHEMDVATYLKASSAHYVRYEVKPIYRGNELVARGVQIRAQSIGDNQIHFNLYIFNIEDGYQINYGDGSSVAK